MSKNLMLTIDWDFFILNKGESDISGKSQTIDGKEIGNIWLYDWSAHENRGPGLCDFLWVHRAAAFIRQGLQLEQEMRINTEAGCVDPKDFLSVLEDKFDLSWGDTWYSDSHAWGITMANQSQILINQPTHIISFDAHCDLGYSKDKVEQESAEGVSDCGSWLYHALQKGYTAEIVYPDWKGFIEWKDIKNEEFLQPYLPQLQVKTWSEFVAEQREFSRPEVIHLCRSSAWTPPWLDVQFMNLVESISYEPYCLDDNNPWNVKVGGYNASQPREWNSKSVADLAEELNNRMNNSRC